MQTPTHIPPEGAQRLSLTQLHAWKALEYGMFLHFGLSTFAGDELTRGDKPSTLYAPDHLDVDQWVQVARDAGMRYAVLTAKHTSGHCLWPSRYTDYHVGTSGNTTDVVEAFVTACQKHGVLPGLYYCSWDNHHLFGSVTPSMTLFELGFTTAEYREFQLAQIEELLTHYGPIAEVWVDIPKVLGYDGRRTQYDQIARLQPNAVIMMNQGIGEANKGIGDGTWLNTEACWPTDLMSIERNLPSSNRGYTPWFHTGLVQGEEQDYYIPGEVCDPIGYEWFAINSDVPRSDVELLGMRLICQARGTNLLLNVPPDTHGRIAQQYVDALARLQKNAETFQSHG